MEKDLGKTSTGIQANVSGLLCYALGILSGVVFFLIEKENKFVRFHAVQSMILSGALIICQAVLPAIPVIGWVMMPLLSLGGMVLWIMMMIKAYQGERFKLPVAGDIAEQKA